jgi:hypothetical protein
MKTRTRISLLILWLALIASLPLIGGCAVKTPTARWAQARASLTAAQDTITQLHKDKIISDDDVIVIHPYEKTAQDALNKAKLQLPAGGDTFDFWMDIVTSAVKNLAPAQIQKLEKPNGAVNPGGNSSRWPDRGMDDAAGQYPAQRRPDQRRAA